MKIERDKWAHALSWFGLGVFLGWYLHPLFAFEAIIAGAIGWEYLNKWLDSGKIIDINDIKWSLIGGITGLILIKLI